MTLAGAGYPGWVWRGGVRGIPGPDNPVSAEHQRRHGSGNRGQIRQDMRRPRRKDFQPRSTLLYAMIAPLCGRVFVKRFFSAKTSYTYTMNYLRQEKCLRDHGRCSSEFKPIWGIRSLRAARCYASFVLFVAVCADCRQPPSSNSPWALTVSARRPRRGWRVRLGLPPGRFPRAGVLRCGRR
jgi:hypothetical protein